MLPGMPGRGTPRHAIRIPNELWDAALVKARSQGEDLAAVIRRALEQYVHGRDNDDDSSGVVPEP
jgi:hypothetical protein